MELKDAVVLITGANRGLGLAFAREALARGARKVYAAARDPDTVTLAGVVPLRLDVNRPEDVAAAAAQCGDVTLLINNAGIAQAGALLDEGSIEATRTHFETNVIGVLRLSQAFAPILKANGGGGVLNVLSVVSWIGSPALATYAISKAATWSLTNGLRLELQAQNTQVLGLHMGFVDTDMARGFDMPKTAPEVIAARALDALAQGLDEVMGDEITQQVKQSLSSDRPAYLPAQAS
ncbi:MAG: SDR family oxidoreductase [Rubrivivax sp.]|nr:MAG: SDR family oxidoreductase [Rubrivivax sp.]